MKLLANLERYTQLWGNLLLSFPSNENDAMNHERKDATVEMNVVHHCHPKKSPQLSPDAATASCFCPVYRSHLGMPRIRPSHLTIIPDTSRTSLKFISIFNLNICPLKKLLSEASFRINRKSTAAYSSINRIPRVIFVRFMHRLDLFKQFNARIEPARAPLNFEEWPMNRRRPFTLYVLRAISRALLSNPLARPSSLRDRNTIVRSDYFFAAHRALDNCYLAYCADLSISLSRFGQRVFGMDAVA